MFAYDDEKGRPLSGLPRKYLSEIYLRKFWVVFLTLSP